MKRVPTPSLFYDAESAPIPARDEMNFCEFPMALLSERPPEGRHELVFRDTVRNHATGEIVPRSLTVTSPTKYGLPTVKDEEVLLGLIALTKQKNNFTANTVAFSRRELITLIGWNDQGYSYQRLIEALDRWAAVFFKYENAWWDNGRKEWVDVSFHVVNSVRVNKPTKNPAGGKITIEWGQEAFQSFQAGYLKQLDLAFYQRLDSAVAKRLFRYLDKHFYHRSRLEYDLLTLAFEHVGLSREYEPWKVKQKLAPAIKELETKGFLQPLGPKDRFLAAGKGKWKVVFQRKAVAVTALPAEEPVPAVNPLVATLTARGVSAKSAKDLAARHPAERIERHVEAFDWLVAKKDRKVSKSPAGFLVKAIDDDFGFPPGFVPAAVKKSLAEEAKKRAAEQGRKERAEAERRKRDDLANRKRIDEFLATLPTDRRETFLGEALVAADPFLVDRYRQAVADQNATMAETYRYLLVERAMQRFTDGAAAA